MDSTAHIAMSGVTLTGIRKTYGVRTVLQHINMELAQGELLCLLGPSGCGKTTLLRILAGFEVPDSGQVMLNGQDVTHLPPNKRRMGMVFQAYSLFPNMTALQNVRFGPRVRGLGDTKAQVAEAERLLAMVGLASHVNKFPHQLSGGQQQRVALARALAVKPDILLLDEPLSALDAKVRAQLRSEIRRIQQETGITTVFVTHDQEEALVDFRPRRGDERGPCPADGAAERDLRRAGGRFRRALHRRRWRAARTDRGARACAWARSSYRRRPPRGWQRIRMSICFFAPSMCR